MKIIKFIFINMALFFVFLILFCLVPSVFRFPFLVLVSFAFYKINTNLIHGKVYKMKVNLTNSESKECNKHD